MTRLATAGVFTRSCGSANASVLRRPPLRHSGAAGELLHVSAVFHYLGPAFAVLLFARVEPLGVAWLRIASAAAVFALWRRPWRAFARLGGSARRTVLGMGAVLAAMNPCFYIAIDRLPLGTVAAIEFLPVIALAAICAHTPRNALALGSAVAGAYLLTDIRIEGEAIGLAFAFTNAILPGGRRSLGACAPWRVPAMAAVVGVIVLTQIPSRVEVLGVALVAAGVAVRSEPDVPVRR